MQKKKTRAEIAAQPYQSKSDIQHLLLVSWNTATRIYQKANELDDKELKYRIMDNRVRTSSVMKVTGLSYNMIEKQIRGESHENSNEN